MALVYGISPKVQLALLVVSGRLSHSEKAKICSSEERIVSKSALQTSKGPAFS